MLFILIYNEIQYFILVSQDFFRVRHKKNVCILTHSKCLIGVVCTYSKLLEMGGSDIKIRLYFMTILILVVGERQFLVSTPISSPY